MKNLKSIVERYDLPFLKFLICASLVSLALFERLVFDLGPNVELITLVTFIAAFYLGRKEALIVGITSLAISDIFIGNTSIALFTWSAYAVIALGAWFNKRFAKNWFSRILIGTGGGAIASFWFFLWTNFGVWLLDSWQMYPDNISGLLQSYIAGLPFLKLQLLGNLLFLPLGFGIVELGLLVYQKIFFTGKYSLYVS